MKYTATKRELLDIPVPPHTSSYKPVSNKIIIDTIEETLYKANIEIASSAFASARNGNQTNMHYALNLFDDTEMQYKIIVQNSYDKSLSLKIASGSHIVVCSNGLVYSNTNQTFKKKHVGEVQTLAPAKLIEFINETAEEFEKTLDYRGKLKQYAVSKNFIYRLVGEMFIQESLINTEQLNVLKKEVITPSYQYACEEDSAWQFYNNVTCALRDSSPSTYIDNHLKFDAYFSQKLGLN